MTLTPERIAELRTGCAPMTREVLELLDLLAEKDAEYDEVLRRADENMSATLEAQDQRDTALAKVAAIEALVETDGAFLKKDTKIKRVQEDRRRDLGAIVTTSMVTVSDVRAALATGGDS